MTARAAPDSGTEWAVLFFDRTAGIVQTPAFMSSSELGHPGDFANTLRG